MTSRRFPGIELTDSRSRLIDQHPRLFPHARRCRDTDEWRLVCPGYTDVPDGWRRIIECVCKRLTVAIAAEPHAEIVVLGLEQKYGTLRVHVSSVGLSAKAQEAVALAADLAEARSSHVCAECGLPGRLWSSGGWLATSCDLHGEGRPVARKAGKEVEVTTRFVDGRPVRTARRYLFAEDCFVSAPVPEEE